LAGLREKVQSAVKRRFEKYCLVFAGIFFRNPQPEYSA